MTAKKEQIAGFDGLGAELLSRLPDMRDPNGPAKPVHVANNLWQRLKADKKRILGELQGCSDFGPAGPVTKFDPAADAESLLTGGAVENLTGPVAESRRASLLRQLCAVEHALPAAEQRVQQEAIRVGREVCHELEPTARDVVEQVLVQMEFLSNTLRDLAQFYQECSQRGLSNRPGHWRLQPLEELLLFGVPGYPSLEYYIAERRKVWGIQSAEKGK